ncbi:MAG: phosphoribosylaminoimidazolesuccinocarboxamide synthase [Anaerolineales bacterium]
MTQAEVEFGPVLAEGKTKIIYAHPTRDDLVYMVHKDTLSAGDGARRSVLPGKGAAACRTNSNVFYVLEVEGVPTHYIGMIGDHINLVVPCKMIPLEVVMRRIAFGSYLRRHPETAEGTRFDPPVVEFFYKDDARHDPLVTDEEIVAMQVATPDEIEAMRAIGRRVFTIIEAEWAKQDVTLVDLKIEFGRTMTDGQLVVADVIDNDSWRIWPGGDRTRQLDKQVYRDLPEVTDDKLRQVLANYIAVAELTDRWVVAEDSPTPAEEA